MLSYSRGPEMPLWEATIGEVLRGTVERFPRSTALISCHQRQRLSWAELGARADAVARGLVSLGGGIGPWSGSYDTVVNLADAFARNPRLHLFVAMGYYDFATVYGAVEWTLAQMHVSPEVRAHNIMTRTTSRVTWSTSTSRPRRRCTPTS